MLERCDAMMNGRYLTSGAIEQMYRDGLSSVARAQRELSVPELSSDDKKQEFDEVLLTTLKREMLWQLETELAERRARGSQADGVDLEAQQRVRSAQHVAAAFDIEDRDASPCKVILKLSLRYTDENQASMDFQLRQDGDEILRTISPNYSNEVREFRRTALKAAISGADKRISYQQHLVELQTRNCREQTRVDIRGMLAGNIDALNSNLSGLIRMKDLLTEELHILEQSGSSY
jgi:hypothetical protein